MKYAKTLLRLKNERELNLSRLPKTFLQELLDEELVEVRSISASRKKVRVTKAFDEYYNNLEQILSATTRAKLTQANSDTKRKKISPQDGLYIAGNVVVGGIDLALLQEGALFLKELPKIEQDILIIGVENFENLIYYKEQLYLFKRKKVLFVFRNKKMLEFLSKVTNEIIYFGDFDLAGISIYLNEVKKRAPKAKFFIPKNINKVIKEKGSSKLYEKQINKYKNLTSSDSEMQILIETITQNQKALEQEFFIQ